MPPDFQKPKFVQTVALLWALGRIFLLLAVSAGSGYFLTATVGARVVPERAYPAAILIAGLVTAVFTWKAGGSLLVTGHEVLRVLAVDVRDLAARPVKSSVPTGFAHSFEFDPVRQELMLASPAEGRVQCFDALTLVPKGLFKAIPGARVITVGRRERRDAIDQPGHGADGVDGANGPQGEAAMVSQSVAALDCHPPGTGIAFVSSQKSLYELHYPYRK